MATKSKQEQYELTVPLDVSGVEGFDPGETIKVLVVGRKGKTRAKTVKLNAKGMGTANFRFRSSPGSATVIVGPADASDEELMGLQTIRLEVPARNWKLKRDLQLAPILIPPYYWHWWRRWCRIFTVRGRVLCPDGSPVPGAKVCASDVDWWWWWSSEQGIGCATTDANGAFEITFRWCCGWWPWWWYRLRHWRLEPLLAEKIIPVLEELPDLTRPPRPDPVPDLSVFEVFSDDGSMMPAAPQKSFNPAVLVELREQLVAKLPKALELTQLRIWPWWPWSPWWDCRPDLIFKVTQECEGKESVIVDETIFDARWDIPTTLDVTLTASSEACCVEDEQQPEGDCMVITRACSDQLFQIGGNVGAPAALPDGYRLGDRPYAGNIGIAGLFGDIADVDYYEFEWSTTPAGPWNAMPAAAAGGFSRYFWGPGLPAGPVGFHNAAFPFDSSLGSHVVESREHFEANNDPLSWGTTRFWTSNRDRLMYWRTRNVFGDKTYYLRVKAWDLVGSSLTNDRILPLCNTSNDNQLVLTLDNRPDTGPGSGHPVSTPSHPCGVGTVHTCTLEPDTDFVAVRINGNSVGACANVDATDGGSLEIDFFAHDPDGHLAWYSLIATYGENLAVNLLSVPGATLTPGPVIPGQPAPAAQVGSSYGAAIGQGAVSPVWHGGMIRLTIPDLSQAFPETCCYELELRAHKRTIVNCSYSYWSHANLSQYSFGVVI